MTDSKHQQIAEPNTILRGQVGSGLHGVTTGADDRDEMGVCIEPRANVIGLDKFEQQYIDQLHATTTWTQEDQ